MPFLADVGIWSTAALCVAGLAVLLGGRLRLGKLELGGFLVAFLAASALPYAPEALRRAGALDQAAAWRALEALALPARLLELAAWGCLLAFVLRARAAARRGAR